MVFMVIMDRLKTRNLVLFMFLLEVFLVLGYDGGREGRKDPPQKLTLFNMLKTTTSTYCQRVVSLVNHAHACFSPPSLDFRSSDEAKKDAGGVEGGGGATEKLKEAVARSLGKSKQSFEDSAKTAAKIAGETMAKIKDKIKKSSVRTPQPEPEL